MEAYLTLSLTSQQLNASCLQTHWKTYYFFLLYSLTYSGKWNRAKKVGQYCIHQINIKINPGNLLHKHKTSMGGCRGKKEQREKGRRERKRRYSRIYRRYSLTQAILTLQSGIRTTQMVHYFLSLTREAWRSKRREFGWNGMTIPRTICFFFFLFFFPNCQLFFVVQEQKISFENMQEQSYRNCLEFPPLSAIQLSMLCFPLCSSIRVYQLFSTHIDQAIELL